MNIEQEVRHFHSAKKTILILFVFTLVLVIGSASCYGNKTYVNAQLGIILSHPMEWQITELETDVVHILIPEQRRANQVHIKLWKGFSVPFTDSLEETVQKELMASYASLEGQPGGPHQVVYGKPVSEVWNNLNLTMSCSEADYFPGIFSTCFVFVQEKNGHVLVKVSGQGKVVMTSLETVIAGLHFVRQDE
jgi:hypothetical protein